MAYGDIKNPQYKHNSIDSAYSIFSPNLIVAADLVYLAIATKATEVNLPTSTLHPNYVYYVLRAG